jgi:hypothetical protein
VLDWFSGRDLGDTRLSIVQTDEYLGMLGPERLLALFHDRSETTAEQVDLGSVAWEAFCSPDPTAVLGVIEAGTRALPFLASALLRHLEQFPSTVNGLSRSEEQALQAIAGGSSILAEAFVAYQEREEPVFLSDAVFASYLKDLSDASRSCSSKEEGRSATRHGKTCGIKKSYSPRRAVRCSGATKTACD